MEDSLHSSMEGSVAVGENEHIDVKCYRGQLLSTKCNIAFCDGSQCEEIKVQLGSKWSETEKCHSVNDGF